MSETTLGVGTTTTGQPGTDAEVTMSVSGGNATLNFTIPRGEPGQNGTNGTNGTDGHNPNLGTYVTSDNGVHYTPELPGAPTEQSDYIVVIDKTDSNNVTSKIYTWDSTGSEWASTGRDANMAYFGSGEPIGDVWIDDTNLVNPVPDSLAKAEDVMQLKVKLQGTTLTEEKQTYTIENYSINGNNGTIASSGSTKHIKIDVGNSNKVRFQSCSVGTQSVGWAFWDENDIPIQYDYYPLSSTTGGVTVLFDCILNIPQGAKYFLCTVINQNKFYCYLGSGYPALNQGDIVNNLTTGGATDVLSAEQGKVLGITVNNLDGKINGLPAINNTISVVNTAGTGISYGVKHDVDLPKGRFFTINVDSFDYVSQMQIYFFNSSGSDVFKQVRLIGTENPTSSFTLSPSLNNRQIEIINDDTAKVGFYISGAQSVSSGTTTITINSDATEGMKQVEVVDNLTSTDTDKALSAKQGKVLKGLIDGIPEIDTDEIKSLEDSVYLGDRRYESTLNVTANTGVPSQFLFNEVVVKKDEYVYLFLENSQLISVCTLYEHAADGTYIRSFNVNSGFTTYKASSDFGKVKIYAAGSNVIGTGVLKFVLSVYKESLSDDVVESMKKTSIQDAYALRENILTNRGYYFDNTYDTATSYDETSYLDKVIESVPVGKHFLFSTDSHIDYSFSGYKSQKQTEIMDYVRKRLRIRNVVFGGDAIGGTNNPNSKYKAAKVLSLFCQEKIAAFGDGFLFVVGNHDVNRPMVANQGLTEETALVSDIECYKRSVGLMDAYGKIVHDEEGIQCYKDRYSSLGITPVSGEDTIDNLVAWMKMHYYYDDVENKIRYVVMESGDGAKSILTTLGCTNVVPSIWSQIPFLIKALQTTPEGYDVVLCQHEVYFDWNNDGYISESVSYLNTYYSILSAFKNKTSMTFSSYATSVGTIQQNFVYNLNNKQTNVNADFTQSKASGRLFIICGHEHFDDAWLITSNQGTYEGGEYELGLTTDDSSLLIVCTDRSCITKSSARIVNETAITKYPNAATYNDYVDDSARLGTINECLFDIVTITPDNKVVCTRVGGCGEHLNGNPATPVRIFELA